MKRIEQIIAAPRKMQTKADALTDKNLQTLHMCGNR